MIGDIDWDQVTLEISGCSWQGLSGEDIRMKDYQEHIMNERVVNKNNGWQERWQKQIEYG